MVVLPEDVFLVQHGLKSGCYRSIGFSHIKSSVMQPWHFSFWGTLPLDNHSPTVCDIWVNFLMRLEGISQACVPAYLRTRATPSSAVRRI